LSYDGRPTETNLCGSCGCICSEPICAVCRGLELAFEKNLIALLKNPRLLPKVRARFTMQLTRLREHQARRQYPTLPVDNTVTGEWMFRSATGPRANPAV